MNAEIEASHRRITVIVDPHIAKNQNYAVYSDGLALQNQHSSEGNYSNIFVKDHFGKDYLGWCWPGNSVWIDFLNENA